MRNTDPNSDYLTEWKLAHSVMVWVRFVLNHVAKPGYIFLEKEIRYIMHYVRNTEFKFSYLTLIWSMIIAYKNVDRISAIHINTG